nr:hypothetical protein [Providencia stuartii]
MDITSGIFTGRASVITRTIGQFELDCTIREAHTSALRITKNPVESGADIADHAFLEPKSLSITGTVVGYEPAKYFNDFLGFDTEAMGEYPLPLEISSSIRQAEAMLGQYITIGRVLANKVQKVIAPWYPDVLKPFADSSQTLDRAGRAYESLLAIQKMGEPIDVQTGLRLYKNMMLTSIGATQDKPGAVEFSLNLEEVFIVESQTVKGLHPDLKQQPQKSNMGRTQPEAKSAYTFRETLGGRSWFMKYPYLTSRSKSNYLPYLVRP